MAFRIIFHKKIYIQYTILDFIETPTWETIDCRTKEGMQRYEEISAPRASNRRSSAQSIDPFTSQAQDIRFLTKSFNECERRYFAGFLAGAIGHGGTKKAARLTGLDVKTIRRGKKELNNSEKILKSWIRREGGGRLTKAQSNPRYERELKALVEDEVAGDPMSKRKWTRKTLRWMKKELHAIGINASLSTIRNTLRKRKISLKKNRKYKSTQNHPERDMQFLYLNKLKHKFLSVGNPVISVDTKKKEFFGNFKNDGRPWRKEALEVLDHDFPSLAEGKLIPFGIYDLKQNRGHVYCGTSFGTSEFAVVSIIRWWTEFGQKKYPNQSKLLVLCDSGGANGYRRRKWKWDLQTKLVDRFDLTVTVCHYPSGASKYNPIEWKLFSFISINWAGEPLTSYEKALALIKSTKTEKGLKVEAELIEKEYKKGLKVNDEQMASLNIKHHDVCPKWNYTIKPR